MVDAATNNRVLAGKAPLGSLRTRIWSTVRIVLFILFTVMFIQRKIFLSTSSQTRRAASILVTGRVQYKNTSIQLEPPTESAIAQEQNDYEDTTNAGSSSGQDGGKRKITLHLIGERHTGTNWMTGHLEKCFPDFWIDARFARFKHWFQDDDGLFHSRVGERQVVIAMFRNVYTWVESMRNLPYHSIEHYHLGWHDFVTRPWTMKRFGRDTVFEGVTADDFSNTTTKHARICKRDFAPFEVIPCLEGNVDLYSEQGVRTRASYELKRDGSGQPYSNILDLRQAKIRNFLTVSDFESVQGFYVVRYEDMVLQGTVSLIGQLEKELNTTAKCVPEPAHQLTKRPMPQEYMAYMRKHVDWVAESLIGYTADDIFEKTKRT